MVKMQNFVIWRQIAHCSFKNKIFIKILQKMLKQNLTLQILNQTDHCLKEKIIGLMKGELGGKTMKEFVGLRTKAYSYLKDINDEDKGKRHKKVCHKKKS